MFLFGPWTFRETGVGRGVYSSRGHFLGGRVWVRFVGLAGQTYRVLRILRFPLGPSLRLFVLLRIRLRIWCSGLLVGRASIDGLGATCLWVRPNLKPVTAQVAFTSKSVDGCRIVVAHFALLRIVANAHANMGITSSTVLSLRFNHQEDN